MHIYILHMLIICTTADKIPLKSSYYSQVIKFMSNNTSYVVSGRVITQNNKTIV